MKEFLKPPKPARIIHFPDRPTNYTQIAKRAARNVHLGKSATALLCFYAGCGEGFRPAMQVIERATGIRFNAISRTRAELSDKGLIEYRSGKCLSVLWDRIRIFAALTEPIKTSQSDTAAMKARGYNPYKPQQARASPTPSKPKRICDTREFRLTRVLHPALLTETQARMLDFLEHCTDAEFQDILGVEKRE